MNMETLLKINEQLWGLPSGPLIAVFAIALGYLLKKLPGVNNNLIPWVVVVFCTAGFMLIAPARTPDTLLRIYLGRNFLIGFVIGFAAWQFHAQILSRWLDPKLFKPDDETQPPKP